MASSRPAGLLIAIGKSPKKGEMRGMRSGEEEAPSSSRDGVEKKDEVRDLLGQAYDAAQEKDKEGFVDLLVSAIKACCSECMDEEYDDSEED